VVRDDEGVHYEVLHLDTHPSIDPGSELLRILINVGQTARRFRFGDVTCAELSHAGCTCRATSSAPAEVERHVPMRW
jgi:hypothetical protein